MISELFLCAALSLPLLSIPDPGDHDSYTKEDFILEYKWLQDFLRKAYPHDEFLIMPSRTRKNIIGWERVPFKWHGHIIYKKPKRIPFPLQQSA